MATKEETEKLKAAREKKLQDQDVEAQEKLASFLASLSKSARLEFEKQALAAHEFLAKNYRRTDDRTYLETALKSHYQKTIATG